MQVSRLTYAYTDSDVFMSGGCSIFMGNSDYKENNYALNQCPEVNSFL